MTASETFFLITAALTSLFLIGGMMVSISKLCHMAHPGLTWIQIGLAYLLGARFDQTLTDVGSKAQDALSSIGTAVPTPGRDEL